MPSVDCGTVASNGIIWLSDTESRYLFDRLFNDSLNAAEAIESIVENSTVVSFFWVPASFVETDIYYYSNSEGDLIAASDSDLRGFIFYRLDDDVYPFFAIGDVTNMSRDMFDGSNFFGLEDMVDTLDQGLNLTADNVSNAIDSIISGIDLITFPIYFDQTSYNAQNHFWELENGSIRYLDYTVWDDMSSPDNVEMTLYFFDTSGATVLDNFLVPHGPTALYAWSDETVTDPPLYGWTQTVQGTPTLYAWGKTTNAISPVSGTTDIVYTTTGYPTTSDHIYNSDGTQSSSSILYGLNDHYSNCIGVGTDKIDPTTPIK